jgi:2-dehydropantoate 2-reductase
MGAQMIDLQARRRVPSVTIVGAGAIGGMLAARLSTAGGARVSLLVRNSAYVDAIDRNGLRLMSSDGSKPIVARDLVVSEDASTIGPQDCVILAVKAHHLGAAVRRIGPLLGPSTPIVTTQNGIPFWYFHKFGKPYEGRRVEAVDPDGEISKAVDFERLIGCIAFPAAEALEPGVIRHVEGDRFPVGELDGSQTERATKLVEILTAGGFKSFLLEDIRSEIWLKLWGNLTFNPISALTHGTLVKICRFPLTRDLVTQMMLEAQAIAEKLGVRFRHTIEKRIAGAESVGDHATSMLQDVQAGRELEIEAILGAVVELGRLTEVSTPHLDAIYACTRLLDRAIVEREMALRGIPAASAGRQAVGHSFVATPV